jgi:predicted MFS family arabinose efflux permease
MLIAMVSTGIVLVTTWGGNEYAWGSPTIIGMSIAVFGLLVGLLVVESRVEQPIVPMHLFRMTTFRVSVTVTMILGIAMFGVLSFLPLFLQIVNGADATNSGLLMAPQTLSLLVAAVVSGRAISRTGRYKVYPIVGTGLDAVVMFMLSTMDSSTGQWTVTVYMILFGFGMGLTIGTLILAVQNAVEPKDIGVGTSSVVFFRFTGGAIGVALFGALFNALLRNRIGVTAAVGEGSSFSPAEIRKLEPAVREEYIDAFAHSITTVFFWTTPTLIVAFVLSFFMHEAPLRERHSPDELPEFEAESGLGALA